MESLTPLPFLWESAGRPVPAGVTPKSVGSETPCALCERGPVSSGFPVTEVVSGNSTIWDDLRQKDGKPILCEACAWAFREESARTSAYWVGSDFAKPVDFATVANALQQPVSPMVAASVPITGRKHVLPFLTWGFIATDAHSRLPWQAREAELARAVKRLRTSGAAWTDIQDAAPGSATRRVSGGGFEDWALLRQWRGTVQLGFIAALMRKAGVKPGETDD